MVIFNVAVRFASEGPMGPLHDMGDCQSPQQATEWLDAIVTATEMEGDHIIASSIAGVSVPDAPGSGWGFGVEG